MILPSNLAEISAFPEYQLNWKVSFIFHLKKILFSSIPEVSKTNISFIWKDCILEGKKKSPLAMLFNTKKAHYKNTIYKSGVRDYGLIPSTEG